MSDIKVNITVAGNDATDKILKKLGESFTDMQAKLARIDKSMDSVDSALRKATRSSKGFADSMNKGLTKVYKNIGRVANKLISLRNLYLGRMMVGAAGRGLDNLNELVQPASQMELLRTRVGNLRGGNPEVARKSQEFLLDFAERAPAFNLESLTKSFVQLRAAGLDPTAGSLEILADAIAAFGGSSADLQKGTLAIQQMLGKGTVGMEELRQQFGERVPGAVKILARELDMTTGKMNKMIEQGLLSADVGVPALLRGLEKDFGGSAAKMAGTWQGMVTKLEIAWFKLKLKLIDDDVFKYLKDQLDAFTIALKASTPLIIQTAKAIGSAFAAVFNNIFGAEGGSDTDKYVNFIGMIVKAVQMAAYGIIQAIKAITNSIRGLQGILSGAGAVMSKLGDMGMMEKFNYLTTKVKTQGKSVSYEEAAIALFGKEQGLTVAGLPKIGSTAARIAEKQASMQAARGGSRFAWEDDFYGGMGSNVKEFTGADSALAKLLQLIKTEFKLPQQGLGPMTVSSNRGIFGSGNGTLSIREQGETRSGPRQFLDAWDEALKEVATTFDTVFKDITSMTTFAVRTMSQSMTNAFDTFFNDAMTGKLQTFKDYFTSFLQDIGRALNRLLAEKATQMIMGYAVQGFSAAIGARGTSGAAGTGGGYTDSLQGNLSNMGKATNVQIVNNTGQPIESDRAKVSFDPSRQVMSIVLDNISRNVGGSRDIIRGMVK